MFCSKLLLSLVLIAYSSAWITRPSTVRRGGPLLAGFGKQDKSSSGSIKPLKPKQQWDRYLKLKELPRHAVAVRKSGEEEWFLVGHVKCQEMEPAAAVTRQRALIADHARRLYPGQVSPKDVLEWGIEADGEDYQAVDKNLSVSKGAEKQMGFQGTADPSSGYYCFYNEGKLVGSGEDNRIQSSKKLQ